MTRFADPAFFASAFPERLALLHPAARVLEVGCGAGATGALALREGLCARWVGVDPDAPPEALYALSDVVADISQVEGSFDVVFASADDLGQAARLLAPGGWLYVDGAMPRDLRRAGLICVSPGRGMKRR